MTLASPAPELSRSPRDIGASRQDSMPGHYSTGVRVLSMLAFSYVAFAYVNGRLLHLFEGPDGETPLWLSHQTEYVVILVFGIWRTLAERNPYTRKRLGFLTAAVAVFWWIIPEYLGLPEPYIGALPGQPIFPQIHTPGTLAFFAILLLVLLFGRRVVCGWNCPCVGIRETVGFAFREKTLRSPTAWNWRYTKWFFFALYMIVFALIMFSEPAYVSPFYGGFLALVAFTYFGSFFIAPLTGNRFYCRYLCPYGATFGLLNHVGYYGIRMDKEACIDCRRCEQACDMGIPVWRQGKEHGRITGLEDCMGCGRCVGSCPTDALEFRDVRNKFLPKLRMDGSYLLKRPGPPEIAPRMEPPKRPAPARLEDWREDRLALSPDDAKAQARRCLDCGVPGCQNACPLHNRIPEWLEVLGKGDVEAVELLHSTNNFPEFTGRVCPALCEAACTLNTRDEPVTIKTIEFAIVDKAWEKGWMKPRVPARRTSKRVAIVGSGPAGLACAQQLARAGHEVVVYEKNPRIGGLLRYGIPDFKLSKHLIDRRIEQMEAEGVRFSPGTHIGVGKPARNLLDEFDAVVLAAGSEHPRDLPVPGRDLKGIHFALEFLTQQNRRINGDPIPGDQEITASGKHVVVIGGGDTGSDCVGTAIRQGARSVTQIEIMPKPAEKEDKEPITPGRPKKSISSSSPGEDCLRDWNVLTKFFSGENGRVSGLHAARVDWAPGENGRMTMKEVDGSEYDLRADLVLLGMGFVHPVQEGLLQQLGVDVDERRNVKADTGSYQTSVPKVFAAGDVRRGQSLVVWAIHEGRQCAHAIDRFLMGESDLAR